MNSRTDTTSTREPALNRDMQRLLRFFRMDRHWVKGEGCWLEDDEGRRFLDCYAQYGAVALGHNHPRLVAALQTALAQGEVAMVQPYRAPHAVRLAERLREIAPAGLEHVVFATSGAEVVETAVRLIRSHSADNGRGRTILCAGDAFHGKTTSALALSAERTALAFGMPPLSDIERVPYGDAAALERCIQQDPSRVCAFIVEPIQGEAGVIVPPRGYLREVRAICDRYDIALIADEIQSGLGRTGRLFACEDEGVVPDVILLAKALGGGLLPLSACLSSDKYWTTRFALANSSTFANNNLACAVGNAALDELLAEGYLEDLRARGELLQEGLRRLAAQHPNVIADVRGRGLMAAIELSPEIGGQNLLLGYLKHQGVLGYGVAGALAELSGVLTLPALNRPSMLRICPPLVISRAEIEQALRGIAHVAEVLEERRLDVLVRALHMVQEPPEADDARLAFPPAMHKKPAGRSYAFIMHYTQTDDLLVTEPALRRLSAREFSNYQKSVAAIPPGAVLKTRELVSLSGSSATGWLIVLGQLPREMFRRGRDWMEREIARSVDLAASLHADVVGLGALTASYSRRGIAVLDRGPWITTGNALTAAMAVEAVRRVCARRKRDLSEMRIGVIGAGGSVGGLCAKLFARELPVQLLLVGNPVTPERSREQLEAEIRTEPLYGRAKARAARLEELGECQIVLSATSSFNYVLDDVPIAPGTLICDCARPYDASPALRARPDVTVIDGGFVRLPDPSMSFGIGNIQGLPPGVQLPCLSETILLALAGVRRNVGVGDRVPLEDVDLVMRLMGEHGFALAEELVLPPRAVPGAQTLNQQAL